MDCLRYSIRLSFICHVLLHFLWFSGLTRGPWVFDCSVHEEYSIVCMYGHTYSKSIEQPGKVANRARGQLNIKNEYFPVRVRA